MSRDFRKVVAALSKEPGVSMGRMFGSEGLKVGSKVFAMDVKGRLVVKIAAERAAKLCEAKLADPFDPGHGRPMKQWISVSKAARVDWLGLSQEAYDFVRRHS